jgi:hypothetical protein
MSTYGFQQIVIANDAIGFDKSIIEPDSVTKPSYACFVVENSAIRIRTDGGIPTPNTGIPLEVGQFVELSTERDIEAFLAVSQDSASTAEINVQFANLAGELN